MNNYEISYAANKTNESACHFHPYYEIVLFDEGQRMYMIEDTCYEIHANCAVLIKPHTRHSTIGKSHVSCTLIYFTDEFLQKYFTPEAIEQLLSCFDSIAKNLNSFNTSIKFCIETMLTAANEHNDVLFASLLGTVLSLFSNTQNATISSADISDDIIPKIIVYIQENFSQINTLDDIAKEFFFSVSYLSSLFRRKTGMSIKKYLIDARINHACQQLVATDTSIYKIADTCGFMSCTHFCNTFRKKMNLSPKQYRKKYHK